MRPTLAHHPRKRATHASTLPTPPVLARITRNFSNSLLTDLSKTFDCHYLKLLLAELHVYVFSIAALILLHSYCKIPNKGLPGYKPT